MFLAAQKQNRAMESIVVEEHPLWHGDMFVVKHDPKDGSMRDVLPSDIDDISELISECAVFFLSSWNDVDVLTPQLYT